MKVVKLEDCINEIKSLDNNGVITRSVNHICEDMRKEVKEFDAIPIAENTTNGDILLTIFDTATVYGIDKVNDCITICIDNNFYQIVRYSWWNAPYKEV